MGKPPIFNEEETKKTADFYSTNYDTLASRGNGSHANTRRNSMILKLTILLNRSRPTAPITTKQVVQKIQDIKKTAKQKSSENNKKRKVTGGEKDTTVKLSVAEELIVAKLSNTPAFQGIQGRGLESGIREEVSEDEESSRASSDILHMLTESRSQGVSTAPVPETMRLALQQSVLPPAVVHNLLVTTGGQAPPKCQK